MKRGKIRKREKKKKAVYDFKHFRKKFLYKLLMIIVIVLFFIALAYLLFFVLEKISEIGEEKGLEGELPSFGIFGGFQETEFLKANCSDENLKKIWSYLLLESSDGITIHSDKDNNEFCNYSLMYKVIDNNVAYYVFSLHEETRSYVYIQSWGIYGNFTDGFIYDLQNPNPDLPDFFIDNVLMLSINNIYGNRNIENDSAANIEYHSKYNKLDNSSWTDGYYSGEKYYWFQIGSIDEENYTRAAIYANLTLDVILHYEKINAPINLTQIQDISGIILNGSKSHYDVINLDDYFENLGYNNYNLSFSYKINESGVFSVWFDYYDNGVNFDTSNTVGGNFIMNITLSHLGWNNRENITSNNFNVTIYGCLDSDGEAGRVFIYNYDNKDKKGTARNLTTNSTDYCVDNSKVMEYYCYNQNIRNYSLSCYSGYYCSDGACVVNTSVEHVPRFLDVCDSIEWQVNTSYVLDMKTCWIDDDGDSLTFRYENSSEKNLSISRTGNNLTLTSEINWNGSGYFYIYASDLKNETRGEVDFRVFKIINVTANITTNQTNVSVNNTPVIKSPLPSSDEINISYNGSLEFSITAENYDSIRWYVDGVLVKSDVGSYTAEKLSEGEHEIKVEVRKGTNVISKSWSLSVSGEETPKKINAIWYFVALMIILGIIILVVIFFIVKNVIEKREENIPKPIIKELRPGTRIGYIPPSKPSYSRILSN